VCAWLFGCVTHVPPRLLGLCYAGHNRGATPKHFKTTGKNEGPSPLNSMECGIWHWGAQANGCGQSATGDHLSRSSVFSVTVSRGGGISCCRTIDAQVILPGYAHTGRVLRKCCPIPILSARRAL